MNGDLSFWQKLMADLGKPNDNGGTNYTDPEMRYYMREFLNDQGDFVPTRVLRDAWRGARIRAAQPMAGGTNDPDRDLFKDMIREAMNTRMAGRNAAPGEKSPTGMEYDEMWNAPLSPSDAIMKKALEDKRAQEYRDAHPEPVGPFPTRTIGRGDNWVEFKVLPYPAMFEDQMK